MSFNDSHTAPDGTVMHQGTVDECAVCSAPVEGTPDTPPDTSIIDAIAPAEVPTDSPEQIAAMGKAFRKGTLPEKDRRA